MTFLEGQNITTLREDPYALAIISYALAISNSTKKMTTYEHLRDIADRSGGRKQIQVVQRRLVLVDFFKTNFFLFCGLYI